jgi:hypothetical protein
VVGQQPTTPKPYDKKPLVGFQAGQSTEMVSGRTATVTLFKNPDGSLTQQVAPYPVHYQDASGAWQNIVTTLQADPSVPGGLMSGANSWSAHFAPLSATTGVTIDNGSPLIFVPVGAAAVSPTINPSNPSQAIYANAWPGVDLEYTVTTWEVKEDLIVHAGATQSTFLFLSPGTSFSADPADAGGLLPSGLVGSRVSLLPPLVKDSSGEPQLDAGSALSPVSAALGGGLSVSLSPGWLASQPASAFPLDVDPDVSMGANTDCYRSDGVTQSPCELQMGNSRVNNGVTVWRTAAFFQYSSIYGAHVMDAGVDLWNGTGAAGTFGDAVWHLNSFQFGGISGSPLATFSTPDNANGAYYDDEGGGLTQAYDSWVYNSVPGAWLMFSGNETGSRYTYQEFQSFELYLTYDYPPTTPVLSSPSNGATFHTPPTLTASSSTADNHPWSYSFYVYSQPNDTGLVWDFQETSSHSQTIPAGYLQFNTPYYWEVQAQDEYYSSAMSPTWEMEMVNSPPSIPIGQSPGSATTTVIDTSTSTFTSGTSVDPDGDPVQYRFQITTGADGQSGRLLTSGWQSGTTWMPPAGTFQDGGAYYWTVQAEDSYGAVSGWSISGSGRTPLCRMTPRARFR